MLSASTIWLIFAAYFAFLIIVAAVVTQREKKQAQGIQLQTGKFSWPILVMTYIASCMSVWVFFAGPGAYYRSGIGYYFSELSYLALFPILCYFTMTKVWLVNQEMNFTTPADFFYARYKSRSLTVIMAIIYLLCAFPFISSVLVSAGRAAEIASNGAVSSSLFCLICGIIMVLFVAIGGVKSTVFADAIQGWLFIGALWAIVIAVLNIVFGGSLVEAFKTVFTNQPEWFAYPGPSGSTGFAARLSYPLCCGIGFTIMLPQVFVRAGYYSSDLKNQRQMAFVAPGLQTLVWTGCMLIGVIALAALPNLTGTDTEMVIPLMINIIGGSHGTLASILMSAFLIGTLAVGLSTANAMLMTTSSIIYKDILVDTMKIKFKAQEKTMVRIVVLIFGALTVLFALRPWQLVFDMMLFGDAIVMPLFPALIAGIYWKRATKLAATVSVGVGAAIVLLTFFAWGLGFVWYGTIGMGVSIVLLVVISLLTKDNPEDSAEFYRALENGHNRKMYCKAKIKT